MYMRTYSTKILYTTPHRDRPRGAFGEGKDEFRCVYGLLYGKVQKKSLYKK